MKLRRPADLKRLGPMMAFIILLGGVNAWVLAEEPTFSTDDVAYFETHIRPLLVDKCLSCHAGEDAESGLRLDTRESLLAGGDSGPGASPGDPGESLIWHAVNYESFEMPPDQQLADEQLAHLKRWIESGLAWPDQSQLSVQRSVRTISDDDRDYWAFRPLAASEIPMVAQSQWCREDLDHFILKALEDAGLEPAPSAAPLALLRRAAFDLTGLPPTAEQVERMVTSPDPQTYEILVDEMLASSRFGEHWGQYWLDLVRYADSDGYKADGYRPLAWRYRDFVIRSLNHNQPFDKFIVQQLAGDLLPDPTSDDLIATGYLRNWIYEYNQRDARTQWQYILDDVTEVTGDVFLGLGMGCARCHDHKYDPVLQEDYFRLQACFSNILPTDRLLAADAEVRQDYRHQLAKWQEQVAELAAQIARLEEPVAQPIAQSAIDKFPPDIRDLFHKDPASLTTRERQLIYLAQLQIDLEVEKIDYAKKLKDDQLATWQRLQSDLKKLKESEPASPPLAWGVLELQTDQPLVVAELKEMDLSPAVPQVLVRHSNEAFLPKDAPKRLALAQWLVSDENPITSRVMVNRVWLRLMGQGLAPNSSDFGQLGGEPTHTELLDYLAYRWRSQGWNLKQLVREIVLSSTYRMSTEHPSAELAMATDPENRMHWRSRRRRLQAGQIRDALLMAAGELDSTSEGPAKNYDAASRTVYLKVLRNKREALLDVFDFPDRIRSQGERNTTTTPLQALLLINSDWSVARAKAMAQRVGSSAQGDTRAGIQHAFVQALSRPATDVELDLCQEFIEDQIANLANEGVESPQAIEQAWLDLCHGLMNSNEFMYLD